MLLQLRVDILPQFLRQAIVMSVPTAITCIRNWRVVLSRFDFLSWRSSSPKRVRCALPGAGHYAWEQWCHRADKPHSKC